MAKEHLKRKAHHPQGRDDVWWYEENDGIYVVMEKAGDRPGYTGPVANTCKIKWSSLRAALARKDQEHEAVQD